MTYPVHLLLERSRISATQWAKNILEASGAIY